MSENPALTTEEYKDPLLQRLVNHTNAHSDDRTPITLQIKGLLVSGLLIAGDTYFEQFAHRFTQGARPEVAETNFAMLNAHGNAYRALRSGEPCEPRETTYLHLECCEILSPAHGTQIAGLWRGKIAEVDGFLLGRLKTL